ncbi:TPA: hypothetical protein GX533_00935 [Candidatus Dojkabacteria bacterium]|uniref:Uncharacterized protein n=1 Tax=Candidatus Dojkabacteria bacterium TaxID=2099670 RepID=A0A832QBH9_9BACT|nr:hypothetical protein [Candidatus Dojkabacteria bacterium]
MKKSYIYILIILVVVGGLVAYIVTKNKNVDEKPVDTTQEQEEERKLVKEVFEDDKKDSSKKKVVSKIESDTDFSSYSSSKQEVGELGDEEDLFVLESITDSKEDGYHSFLFTLSGEKEPHAVATYNATSGVVRVDFYNIEKDSSGIPYQGKRDINVNGITKLYRAVSGIEKRSIYEVGVEDETVFKLTASEGDTDGKWKVVLNVKYPGERDVDVDLGSEEFSREDQEIKGGSEGSLLSYSYSAGGGVMKFVWGVSASGTPIPSVKASLNDDGDLVVLFEDVKMDKVGGKGKTFALPFKITASSDSAGSYLFTGLTEKYEYRLSAGLSPNQVILEIK